MIREGEPRLLLESAVLGVVGAFGAQLFTWMLHLCKRFFLYGLAGYIPPGIEKGQALYQTTGEHGLWIIPAVTTLGGSIFRNADLPLRAGSGRSWHGCGRNGVSP